MSLDINVGEIWLNENNKFERLIVHVDDYKIVAVDANNQDSFESYLYDRSGKAASLGDTFYNLTKKKPVVKTQSFTVYVPVFKKVTKDELYLGGRCDFKSDIVEKYNGFIKWIEYTETIEYESE